MLIVRDRDEVENCGLRRGTDLDWYLVPLPMNCVTLGSFANFSIPRSSHLENGDKNSLHLKGLE